MEELDGLRREAQEEVAKIQAELSQDVPTWGKIENLALRVEVLAHIAKRRAREVQSVKASQAAV